MSSEQAISVLRYALFIALELATPFLLLALVIGILFSFLQTLFHIQEMTLSFAPKMLAIGVALTLLFPWMLKIMIKFTNSVLVYQWDQVIHAMDTIR